MALLGVALPLYLVRYERVVRGGLAPPWSTFSPSTKFERSIRPESPRPGIDLGVAQDLDLRDPPCAGIFTGRELLRVGTFDARARPPFSGRGARQGWRSGGGA